MCGIVAVVVPARHSALPTLGNGAHFLQHRGPAYSGFFVFDPASHNFRHERERGLADQLFSEHQDVQGNIGIAHNRYKTHGEGGIKNAQPFYDGITGIALGHNGQLWNFEQITKELSERGYQLRTTSDSEGLLWALGLWKEHFAREQPQQPEKEHMFAAIREVQLRVKGAFSVVAATPEGIYAFKDPHGRWPLEYGVRTNSIGQRTAVMAASETISLERNGFVHRGSVPHGGALFVGIDLNLEERIHSQGEYLPCAFDDAYFGDATSMVHGERRDKVRKRGGHASAMYLLETAPHLFKEGGIAVPVPNTPVSAAQVFADTINGKLAQGVQPLIRYSTPIWKYRYGGRIFLEDTQGERDEAANRDLYIDEELVRNQSVWVIEDSFVRGTNGRRVAQGLRKAGAQKIYFVSYYPMVVDSCFDGINTPTQAELIAHRFGHDIRKLEEYFQIEGLFYLPAERYRRDVLEGKPACMSCTNTKREYHVDRFDGRILPPEAPNPFRVLSS